MLDLSDVDLGMVAEGLDDHSFSGSWWIDADTGEVWYWRGEDEDDDPEFDPEHRPDARVIDPLPSFVGYGDMEDFIDLVPDPRAADLLACAIAGRGAFRRFKDTLLEFPALREHWFLFSGARMERRAIELLVDEELVDRAVAERAIADRPDPEIGDAGRAVDATVGVPRPGYRSITPRIVVPDVAAQVAFLQSVFDAATITEAGRPTEVRVGDSPILLTPTTEREPFPAFLYVYVVDADAAYERAIVAGAISLEPPFDTPYGDRRAMVLDPFGNVFQIAHRISAR